jgi:hypothetical protein
MQRTYKAGKFYDMSILCRNVEFTVYMELFKCTKLERIIRKSNTLTGIFIIFLCPSRRIMG